MRSTHRDMSILENTKTLIFVLKLDDYKQEVLMNHEHFLNY